MKEWTSKYMDAEVVEEKPKTKVYALKSKHYGDVLGYVKLFAPWRQYCLYVPPEVETWWSRGCLEDVNRFITSLMEERKHF